MHLRIFIAVFLFLTPLLITFPAQSTVVSPRAVQAYKQLIDVVHLNSKENTKYIADTLEVIDKNSFDGIRAPIFGIIAKLETNNGNITLANDYIEKAIAALNKTANHSYQIDALNHISWVYINRGDYATAIYYVQQMADYAFEHQHIRGQAIALNRLGQCYIELGLSGLSFVPLENALAISRQHQFDNTELLALLYLANAGLKSNKLSAQEIIELVEDASIVAKKMNYAQGYINRLQGLAHQMIPQYDISEHWFKQSLAIATSEHDVRLLRLINFDLAKLNYIQHNDALALSYAQTSMMYANRLEHLSGKADLHYLLSQINQRQGNTQMALEHLNTYTDFLRSDNNKNAISLLTIMDKRINGLRQKNKMIALENSVLSSDLAAQKAYNERHTTVMWLAAILFIFIGISVSLFIRHRLMAMKVAISMKDALTGAYARSYLKHFLPLVRQKLAKEKSLDSSFGILLIDCDDFKQINDEFGHGGGDVALKKIVETINTEIRAQDTLFRWGGDEFVLMCQSVSKEQLNDISSRINKAVCSLNITYGEGAIHPTISIGYALHARNNPLNLDELLKVADDYLYQSKRAGKNSVFGV